MDTKEKKTTILRLVIFCILAYLPLYVITPILNNMCGELIYSENRNKYTNMVNYIYGFFFMFTPSLAQVITRLFTKEGFKNTYLRLNLKGNIRYYVASIVVKLMADFAIMFLIWAIFIDGISFRITFLTGDWQAKAYYFFFYLGRSILIIFLPAFGEEWGWRGYMMPKLMKLMPKSLAIIVGGIIWGLWHAPLTISGHNFGTDYKFYPWLGILFMCTFCILLNAFLTFLTERTKSVYPAAFCHAVNNGMGAMLLLRIFAVPTALYKMPYVPNIVLCLVRLPILAIIALVSYLLLIRKEKEK